MRSIRGSSKGWSKLKNKQKGEQPKKGMKCYQKRNEKLSLLGYASYTNYLKSDLWQTLRLEHLRKYPDCILCQKPANQIHHLGYDIETLLGMKPFRLVQMCKNCHQAIEFDGPRKRTVYEATGKLFKLAEETERGRAWVRYVEIETCMFKKNKRKKQGLL